MSPEWTIHGLTDRSRRPYRHANQLPLVIETEIVRLKRQYPDWGAPKIREKLRGRTGPTRCPAISTVHAVLDRHGLVQRRGRRRRRATGTPLSHASTPNALWYADYKGEFRLGNRQYCYPLTITDFASRYLLTCEALSTTGEHYAFAVFERTFKDFGLPHAIRTDNGVPFASAHALYGLSKLAVWWLRLGVGIERIKPGHPEQNGRHQRMHLTLKQQATQPAAATLLQAVSRTRRARLPAARPTGPLRCFSAAVQPRPPTPGARHAGARRPLRALRAAVSRWEHGRTPMGTTADRLLRLMVVVAEGTACPLNSLRTVALDGPKVIPVHARWHDDRWEVSIG